MNIIKSSITLFLTLTLSACGNNNKEIPKNPSPKYEYSPIFSETDPEFQTFINDFEIDYLHYSGDPISNQIPVNFYDLESLNFLKNQNKSLTTNIEYDLDFYQSENKTTMAGVCLKYSSGKKEILIDKKAWNKIETGFACGDSLCIERKKFLIYHELAHCIFNRKHKDDKHHNYYLSLMNSTLIRQSDIEKWEKEYIYELFSEDHSEIETKIDELLNSKAHNRGFYFTLKMEH